MPTTALQRTKSILQSHRTLLVVFAVALGAGMLAVPVAADDPNTEPPADDDRLGFADDQVPLEVESGETVAINVTNTDGDRFDFELDHVGEQLHLEATLEPDADDVTILLDTGTISDDPEASLSTSDGEVRTVTVHENEGTAKLRGGSYSVSVDNSEGAHVRTMLVQPTVRFETDGTLNRSALDADPIVTVEGTTEIEPGEPLELRLESGQDRLEPTDGEPVLLENETVVGDDGTFDGTFNMSTVSDTSWLYLVAEYDDVVRAERPLVVDEDRPADPNQESHGVVIVYDGPTLELDAAPDQEITGEADLEPGEPIEIRLESTGESSFLISEETTVDDHGTFETSADLDVVEPGSEFEVTVAAPDDPAVYATAPGVVLDPSDDETDATTTGQSVDFGDDQSILGTSNRQGIGALAIGTALAVIGIAVMLGVRRTHPFE